MWVLKRTDQGRGYVARPGSRGSYTDDIRNAKTYGTKESAEADSCPGNEIAVSVESQMVRCGR